jgi:hypothetical protein
MAVLGFPSAAILHGKVRFGIERRHGRMLKARKSQCFRGICSILLFIEIFFDRVVGFVNVRPLFPTARQGCRA